LSLATNVGSEELISQTQSFSQTDKQTDRGMNRESVREREGERTQFRFSMVDVYKDGERMLE
jgi:hypothetical protein